MALQQQLDQYLAAVEGFESGNLGFEALVDIGIEKFLSGEPSRNATSDDELKLLVLSGPGGRVLAAIILLATEPDLCFTRRDLRPMLVEEFRPLLLACRDQPWNAVVRLDPDTMLGQSYMRQAMVMIALLHENYAVAEQLIALGSPPKRCLFAEMADTIMPEEWKLGDDKILVDLITHGWFWHNLANFLQRIFLNGANINAVKFIGTLYDAQETSPVLRKILAENQDNLLEAVASRGDPHTLDYLLRRLGRWEKPPNFLVPATTKAGSQGSVAMLRYLIEERGMDADWMKTTASNNPYADFRERGYPDPLPDSTTALHGAARTGDVDALKYLLKRGVPLYRRDGTRRNPEQTAADAKQDRVVAILRAFGMRQRNWESL